VGKVDRRQFLKASAATAAVAASAHPALSRASGEATSTAPSTKGKNMELGNFSVSLSVKDLQASRAFYEKLGFSVFIGDAKNWLIMKNGPTNIGLFQGMFPKNTLTFNPGWDSNGNKLESFTDVRELQRRLKASGVAFASEADEKTTGPGSFMVMDPDGNPVLFDQHV
jgi:lactoylglutathione lyase